MAITGNQMAQLMGRGVNLGQCFDNNQNSRSPTVVRPILDAIKKEGFQTVRIPVTWWPESKDRCMLDDSTFMSQLDNAIYYAISLNLIVLLNTHHEDWLNNGYTGAKEQNDKFWAHWRGIATRYKNIPQNKLIFQILNEPHGSSFGTQQLGNCNDQRCLELTRLINKTGFDGVRYVDEDRIVAVMPNNLGNCYRCNPVYESKNMLPGYGNDKYLMFTCHTYDTFNFCGQDGNVNMYTSTSDPVGTLHKEVDARLQMVKDWQNKMGGPDVIGVAFTEYGIGRTKTENLNNYLVREHFKYTAMRARALGFGIIVWSDCGWFKLYDLVTVNGKTTVNWIYGLKDAILNK